MEDPEGADRLQQKLARYKPSTSTIELIKQTNIILLVGVSGAGKDSIKQGLLKTGAYHHIVSHTTRKPRENHGVLEQDGQDYHFINLDEAEQMLDRQEFVEAKLYSGNLYATSATEIQIAHDNHKIAVTDIEVQGVVEYKSIATSVQAVLVLPPSYEVWQQRLKERYDITGVDSKDIERRMKTAKLELSEALDKDYFSFVVNNDLVTAIKTVDAVAHGTPVNKESENARVVAKELLAKL